MMSDVNSKQKYMNAEEMKTRKKQFAIDVGYLILGLPKNDLNRNYSNQLTSKADFINKLKIVEEELDESILFLELLSEFNADKKTIITAIALEGDQLLKIIVASINTSRGTS